MFYVIFTTSERGSFNFLLEKDLFRQREQKICTRNTRTKKLFRSKNWNIGTGPQLRSWRLVRNIFYVIFTASERGNFNFYWKKIYFASENKNFARETQELRSYFVPKIGTLVSDFKFRLAHNLSLWWQSQQVRRRVVNLWWCQWF